MSCILVSLYVWTKSICRIECQEFLAERKKERERERRCESNLQTRKRECRDSYPSHLLTDFVGSCCLKEENHFSRESQSFICHWFNSWILSLNAKDDITVIIINPSFIRYVDPSFITRISLKYLRNGSKEYHALRLRVWLNHLRENM
jgi:hypothetical protein